MKVIFRNPTNELIERIKEEAKIPLEEREGEASIEGVIDIKDISKMSIYDFLLYVRRSDIYVYVDNSDFSEMEVRL